LRAHCVSFKETNKFTILISDYLGHIAKSLSLVKYENTKLNSTIFVIIGLPEDFHSKDYKVSSDPPCIIEKLCSLHYGLVLEAKGIKEHFWKPYIRKLFDKKVGQCIQNAEKYFCTYYLQNFNNCNVCSLLLQLLKGKDENLTGFLDPGNFGDSL